MEVASLEENCAVGVVTGQCALQTERAVGADAQPRDSHSSRAESFLLIVNLEVES